MLVLEFEMFVRPDLVDLLIIGLTYNKCLYTVDTFRVDKTRSFFILFYFPFADITSLNSKNTLYLVNHIYSA